MPVTLPSGVAGAGYGFSILSENNRPLVTLSFATREDAEEALAEVASAVEKAVEVNAVRLGRSRSGACRPLLPCILARIEGNGRRRRVGERGCSEARPHATRVLHENTPLEHPQGRTLR